MIQSMPGNAPPHRLIAHGNKTTHYNYTVNVARVCWLATSGKHDPARGQHHPAGGQHHPARGQHDPAGGQHHPAGGQHESCMLW